MGAAVEEQQVFSIFFLVPIQQHGPSYILFLQPQEASGWADLSIFWRRGGNGGQDGADGEHSKDIKEAGVEVEQSNRGDGGASHF